MSKLKYISILALLALILEGCTTKQQRNNNDALQIVCTTGIIEDAIKNIVKNKAQVIALMGAGVDPHLYKATHGDLQSLSSANLIVYNGLHLEGKMAQVLEIWENQTNNSSSERNP